MKTELTGRKVLAIVVGGFGIIIAVNMVLAVQAVRTFPGLETANSYVASQRFERDRMAQEALGWSVVPGYEDGVLEMDIRDRAGAPAPVRNLQVIVGRPTQTRDDQTPEMVLRGEGVWSAPLDLAPGQWNIRVQGEAPDGTVFRQRIDHYHGRMVKG